MQAQTESKQRKAERMCLKQIHSTQDSRNCARKAKIYTPPLTRHISVEASHSDFYHEKLHMKA
jgi:hypothetical protein